MGFLSGSSHTKVTIYSGLQVQSTSSALPIPIIWGRNLLAPNVLWYNNFKRHNHQRGKGGFFATGNATTYTADVIMGICEGPVAEIGNVWQGSPSPTTLAKLKLSFFNGATPQSSWSYLATTYPSQALSYNGTCYVCAANFKLGPSASIPSNNFEIYGVLQGTGFNGIDADPAQIIYDFLTNSQYGVGFPAASISGAALYGNNSSSFQAFCFAAGIAFSPVLIMREKASSILDRWLRLANATAVWSDGLLKIVPFADSSLSANGWTFAPNLTPIYSLTDEDFLYTEGEDPVKITRADPYSAPNWQAIEIQSRADQYNTGPITAFDQAAIDRFGRRVGPAVTAHEICDLDVAQTVAQLVMQRALYVRNTYQFKLSWEFCLLEPMDLVQINDAAIGVDAVTVRITDIEEDDSGLLTVTAEELPHGVDTSVVYPIQPKISTMPDGISAPNGVNPPLIIEPPPQLTNNALELWFGISPQSGDPRWGGCVIYMSRDGATYEELGAVTDSAQQGVLPTSLPSYAGANPDDADSLAVDLTESMGTLSSWSSAQAAAGDSICYVGGEYLSYENATLTAAGKYDLTGLYRGQAGIASVTSSAGAPFCLLDSAIFKWSVSSDDIGQTLYFKFDSFNTFLSGFQDLGTLPVFSYTVQGTGKLGPVASQLALGVSMDFGHVANDVASEMDDYGSVSSQIVSVIDLGNCTS